MTATNRKSKEQIKWDHDMDEAMNIPDPDEKREIIAQLAKNMPTAETKRVSSVCKTATDFEYVGDLAKRFLTKFGKKGLTRRHVMAFLYANHEPQFLASDVVRCLRLRHSVDIHDVLDQFPVVIQTDVDKAMKVNLKVRAASTKPIKYRYTTDPAEVDTATLKNEWAVVNTVVRHFQHAKLEPKASDVKFMRKIENELARRAGETIPRDYSESPPILVTTIAQLASLSNSYEYEPEVESILRSCVASLDQVTVDLENIKVPNGG